MIFPQNSTSTSRFEPSYFGFRICFVFRISNFPRSVLLATRGSRKPSHLEFRRVRLDAPIHTQCQPSQQSTTPPRIPKEPLRHSKFLLQYSAVQLLPTPATLLFVSFRVFRGHPTSPVCHGLLVDRAVLFHSAHCQPAPSPITSLGVSSTHTAKQLHSKARRQQCGSAAMRHAGSPRPITRHAEGVQQRPHHPSPRPQTTPSTFEIPCSISCGSDRSYPAVCLPMGLSSLAGIG